MKAKLLNFQTPDAADERGETAAWKASRAGNLAVLQTLREACADFEKPDDDGFTPLHIAVGANQVEAVRLLVDCGADVNAVSRDEVAPLHTAAQNGQQEAFFFIGSGFIVDDPRTRDLFEQILPPSQSLVAGVAVPHWGCCRPQYQRPRLTCIPPCILPTSVKLWVQFQRDATRLGVLRGCEVLYAPQTPTAQGPADWEAEPGNWSGPLGETPLFIAAQPWSCIESAGAQKDRAANDGSTPLLIAAVNNQWPVFRYLVEEGVDVQLAALDGTTPLSVATQSGSLEDVRLLVNARANIEGGICGGTLLSMAAKHGQLEMVRFLVEAGADKDKTGKHGATPLSVAAKYDQLSSVQYLIEARADKDKIGLHGASPLLIAAKYGQVDMVRFLLDARAKDTAGPSGSTPLQVAVQSGMADTVSVLVEASVELDRRSAAWEASATAGSAVALECFDGLHVRAGTAWFSAAQDGHLRIVRCLVQAKANLNAAAEDGATPLFIAAQSGHLQTVRFLANAGADLNKVGQHGATALFIAVLSGQLEMVEVLVEVRCSLDSAGQDGATPLFVAAQAGHLDMVRCLLQAGADTERLAENGQSALDAAAASCFHDVVEILQACPENVYANAVVLAMGTADLPIRLGVPGEDLPWVTHRPPIHSPALMAKLGHLLVVGAGLSAADAILHALRQGRVRVTHVFRGKAKDTKIGKMFGTATGSPIYGEEEWLAQLMAGEANDERYLPLAESELVEIAESGCRVRGPQELSLSVSVVSLLLGAAPRLDCLPTSLRPAALARPRVHMAHTTSTAPTGLMARWFATLQLADAETGEVLSPNVFAIGPLRGDNFVRFLVGDAYAVRRQVLATAGEKSCFVLSCPGLCHLRSHVGALCKCVNTSFEDARMRKV
ncbi:ANK1 [Symbiodinium natans]|uniref:ANK1 protein n=1 Tax=Symbiodinium natans TaxID=878477 RepID=A0A812UBS3_9DINO|nr:ANK1 [Symbiodinium natans]